MDREGISLCMGQGMKRRLRAGRGGAGRGGTTIPDVAFIPSLIPFSSMKLSCSSATGHEGGCRGTAGLDL